MTRRNSATIPLAFAVLALAVPATARAQTVQPPPGFTSLFNGRDLTGWQGIKRDFSPKLLMAMSAEERTKQFAGWTEEAKKNWRVENGELVNDGNGPYLCPVKEYGDIELLIEYKTVPLADSGIYLRGSPQVQIWDSTNQREFRNGADKGSGGLFNNTRGTPGRDPLVLADKPFGEWNSFRILQVGERTTVYFNGKLVVNHARMENYWERDRNLPLFRTGLIELQTHGGEIRWRNIFVREIPSDEANAILAKNGDDGFRSVFNGRDFDGWAGPTDNYEVRDGAIVCQPRKGGTIFTKEEFSDFVARLEYRLPPAGNNGLAIRYPGQGDTAYVGMCEVQILDDTSSNYNRIDPRQANGSVYGMVAAQKGYLRPVGEWNFMEVTVKGPTIRVELNGTLITVADVSKVTQFLANNPHPGKDRTSGSFGFAGHNDPVAFRNIRVKPLK
jgi:hypothetical protein